MSVGLISSLYFIKLVHLPVLSILSPRPDFIYLCPGLDLIYFESRSGSYQGSPEGESGSRFYQFLSLGPDFIHRVQVRVLSFLSPGPDFIKHVRVCVWILPTPLTVGHSICIF